MKSQGISFQTKSGHPEKWHDDLTLLPGLEAL